MISSNALDTILALQLTVAWAGEGLSAPKRLDWWKTDLIDEDGGGDFFARLLPKTARWAGSDGGPERRPAHRYPSPPGHGPAGPGPDPLLLGIRAG